MRDASSGFEQRTFASNSFHFFSAFFFFLLYFVGIFVLLICVQTSIIYILYYFVSQFSVLFFALAYSESSRVSEDTIYTWKFFGVFRNSSDFRLRRNLFLFFFSFLPGKLGIYFFMWHTREETYFRILFL